MALDSSSVRRRAAVAVLSEVLDEAALLDALFVLHDSLRSDNVTDVIRYIDTVVRKNGLDAGTAKRLYPGFFGALKKAEDELPLDPLPMMMAARQHLRQHVVAPAGWSVPVPPPPPLVVVPTPVPIPVPVAVPVIPLVASGAAETTPVAVEPVVMEPPQVPKAPEVEVFAALMHDLVERLQSHHAADFGPVRSDVLLELERSRLPTGLRQQIREAWAEPEFKAWKVDAQAKELSELVHQVYVAVCENLGPVNADRIMTAAVQTADRLPQARQFSPKKFM